jgi:hypothetical protein
MSSPIRACSICAESFWSIGPEGVVLEVCPVCAALAEPQPEPATEEEGPPRFVSLSALPPDKRMPPRREGRPGLFVPRRLEQISGGVSVPPMPAMPPVSSPPLPLAPPMPSGPQLGFNCPSCFTVLFIKEPQQYDGRAAPCPYCGVTILPPRVAPPSPFLLVAPAPAGALTPPTSRTSRWKPFRRNEYADAGEVELAHVA